MNGTTRMRLTLAGTLSLSLGLAVGALWFGDNAIRQNTEALAQRLGEADKARLEGQASEQSFRVIKPLAVLADAKRGELIAGVQAAADKEALRTWGQTEADPANALKAVAEPMQAVWKEALLLDRSGKVLAHWPTPTEIGANLGGESPVKALTGAGITWGIPSWAYGRPKPTAKTGKAAQLLAACGIEGKAGAVGGILLVRSEASLLVGAEMKAPGAFAKALPGAAGILVSGSGDELWHSNKEAFSENLATVSPVLKEFLSGMMRAPEGRASLPSYDGQSGVMTWTRVGSAPDGAPADTVLFYAAFLPLQTGGVVAAPVPVVAPFYEQPLVLGLLILALLLPLIVGALVLPGALAPFKAAADQSRKISEQAALPALLFPEVPDEDLQAIAKGMGILVRRAGQSEGRVKELEVAIKRTEESSRASVAKLSTEVSEVRQNLSETEASKQAAEAKFDAAQKARQEAESQASNLRSGLETAARNADLKSAEAKNLSSQVQDLMRALEEQRKVAEKAQESMGKKDGEMVRLAAVNTLGTELKSTLTVIKNYISTMLGSQGAISDAQQEFLGVVINKSARLERLIGDLVELSEIGSALKPLRLEAVSPAALVQECLVSVRPQAEHKKIGLDFAEGGGLPTVQVDKEKMGTVIRGLLGQAVKVTSRNEKIGVLLSDREGFVELRVTDPGMSLPPDRAAKVFSEFHGVDSQSGPEFIGTGLRFPILKSLVEAHGGKIWIESQVGRGKTFVVSMPRTVVAKQTTVAMAPTTSPPVSSPVAVPSKAVETAPKPGLAGLPPLGAPPAAKPVPAPAAAAPTGLPTLGPPPAVVAPAPKPAAPIPGAPLPALGSAPPPAPEVKKPAAGPVIHKPAPLDTSLAAPWKRKAEDEDDLLDMEPLAPPTKASASTPPLPPPTLAQAATNADFDKIFAVPGPGAPPAAKAAGGKEGLDLDAIFGQTASPPKPSGPAAEVKETPKEKAPDKPAGGLSSMDDLNKLLGN